MIRTTALLVTVIAALGSAGAAAAETTFTQVSRHYEAIRRSLMKDSTARWRRRAGLRPDEAIGNPYAPSMLRCGEVVQR